MKSNIYYTAATFLLVVTYLLVLQIEPDESADMTRCVPNTALIYFEQRNGYESLTNLSTSPLGKKMESIDFAAVAKEIGAAEGTIATINNVTMAIKSIQDDLLIKALFGTRFALAVLPPLSNSSPIQDKSEFLREHLVIIAEPQHPARVRELFAATFQGSAGDVTFTGNQYGRHRIMRIVQDRQTFSLVTLDGFFVISQNERQLRICIDTFDGEQPSFSGNAEFLALKNSFPASDSLLALPLKNVREHLPVLFAGHDFSDVPFFTWKGPSLAGIKAVSFGAKRHKSTVKKKLIVHYTTDENVSAPLRDQLTTQSSKTSRLSLITPNPMFYMWCNSFNLNNFIFPTGDRAKNRSSDAEFVTRLEAIAGKNFVEYLAMFGKEIIVIAEQGSTTSPLLLPLAMIFIPVSDKDSVKAILKELLATYNIPIKSGEYGPAEYVYWSQSPQDGLYPLYGFFGELFFLGNSETLMQKVIDTNGRGFSLLDIDSVKRIDPGLAKENNSVIYSNNTELIEIIKNTLITLGTLMAIEDRQFAMKVRVVISKVLTPLLDGAKMYDASAIRSYCTPEMIMVDMITNISNHP